MLPSRKRKKTEDLNDGRIERYEYFFQATRTRRVQKFAKLIRTLCPLQKLAVEEIGFGGLLHFNTDSVPDEMNEWMIECFDPVSRYFLCEGKIRFSLTALDAKRVFGLNVNPDKSVVLDKTTAWVRLVLNRWKETYELEFEDSIDSRTLHTLLRRLRQGGDDFKRFFVLYAMHMLLSPDFDSHVDLDLVHPLVDVESIKDCNWGGFVVESLCKKIFTYKTRATRGSRGCAGCLLLLQLTYFHNTIWPDSPLPNDEPLIQHWGGTKIVRRVMSEMKTRRFGSLLFKKISRGVSPPIFKQIISPAAGVGSSTPAVVLYNERDAHIADLILQVRCLNSLEH